MQQKTNGVIHKSLKSSSATAYGTA